MTRPSGYPTFRSPRHSWRCAACRRSLIAAPSASAAAPLPPPSATPSPSRDRRSRHPPPGSGSITAAFRHSVSPREIDDRGTLRLGSGSITAFPPPVSPAGDRRSRHLRLGSGSITAASATRQPKPEIADRGTLRLGSGSITAAFRHPPAQTRDRRSRTLPGAIHHGRLSATALAQSVVGKNRSVRNG
jgi:hypothetical protein